VIPTIWTPGKKSLYEPFVKLLCKGSITSNADYWLRLKTLFDILRTGKLVETSELISWVKDGLLVGAAKELRPSAGTAYEVSYNILIDLISNIGDNETRMDNLRKDFEVELHRYLSTNETFQGAYLNQAFSIALLALGAKHLGDFDYLWRSECQWLRNLMSNVLTPPEKEASFDIASQRWVDLTVSMLQSLNKHTVDGVLTSILEGLSGTLEAALRTASNMKGTWTDGMSFLASISENSSFRESLRNARELQPVKQAVLEFMSSSNIIQQLHSPSSTAFIRFLFSCCVLFGEEALWIWETFIREVLPESGDLNVRSPDSLLAQVLQIPQRKWESLRGRVKLQPVNSQNLVHEFASAINGAKTAEAGEKERLRELIVSTVSLRGNAEVISITDLAGILISDETATSIFWSLDQNSDSFLPIYDSISRRDPAFLGILLQSQTAAGDLKLPTFIYRVYQSETDHQGYMMLFRF